MSGLRWYVVETLPRKEALASRNLDQQDFANFCPRFRTTRSHAGRTMAVLAPLFPGYLFVRFDPGNHPWRSINGTLGVRRLIGFGQTLPQAMPEFVMRKILARCENGIMTPAGDPFERGDIVRITSGAFVDRIATVERYDSRERVRILMEFLGAQHAIEMPVDCLVTEACQS